MTSTVILLVVLAVVVVGVVVWAVGRSRSAHDGVASFRRQIDALSPEARRPVIDQVHDAAERQRAEDEHDGPGGPDEGGDRGA